MSAARRRLSLPVYLGTALALVVGGVAAVVPAAAAAPAGPGAAVQPAPAAKVKVVRRVDVSPGVAPLTSHVSRAGAVAGPVGAGQPVASLLDVTPTLSSPSVVVVPAAVPVGGSGVSGSAVRRPAAARTAAGVRPLSVTTGATQYPAPATVHVQSSATLSPSYLYFTSAAYDSTRNVDVVFGGDGGGSTVSGKTWTWDGRVWTQQSPVTSPSARLSASMAFDAATGTTILFGGVNGSSVYGDTWSWSGSNWTLLSPATSPPARDLASMAYDSALGKIVLFGGTNGSTDLSDTWTWNGTTWTSVTTPSG